MAHETENEAIRRALLERQACLMARTERPGDRGGIQADLEKDVWPLVPAGELGRVLSREEEDQLLGYGPEGF